MAITAFPRRLLREKSHSWNLLGVSATAGQTATNVSVIVRSDGGGFWSCTMTDVSLGAGAAGQGRDRQKAATLLWRAVRQIADGGSNQMVVPRNDALFRPWPTRLAQGVQSIPHSNGALFSTGAGYERSIIQVTSASASLRDTQLFLTLIDCAPLQGGECFSINHGTVGWRLYEIATVSTIDDTNVSVNVRPPLREDVPNGTQLEFDRPRCVMRLATPNAMDLTVQPWTFNSASSQFVETF